MEYALIKLITGDEILARIERHADRIVVHDPVQVVRQWTRFGPHIGVTEWLPFVAEKKATISHEKIVAIVGDIEDNAIQQYLHYVENDRTVTDISEEMQEEIERAAKAVEEYLERGANTTVH